MEMPGFLADIIRGRAVREILDGGLVGIEKALRILCGQRSLTQHIVGIAVALLDHFIAALDRAFDGLAQHELIAHFLHGRLHGGPDHRLAEPFDRAVEAAGDTGGVIVVQHLARQHQRPGRGIDQR